MKKISIIFAALMLALTAGAQTLNVKTGSVTYLFPAAQTGDMTYSGGTTLTIMGNQFAVSDIDAMIVDDTPVTDNTVSVSYCGSSASVVISGNVAQYLTPEVNGAHVSIAQSDNLAEEITYTLTGETNDGEFYMSGSYKATVELNGLTLANTTPVYSGAAIHIQNGKRIKVKPLTGTVNTLVDAATGSQKGCLYVKGHAEFAQKGTLNVTGRVKHAIKTGEYMTLKNATINVLSATGDGINCAEFFLMESGTVNIVGTADDGIQCDLDGTTSTGMTNNHEDEDSGNIYIEGGTVNICVTANAAKGIKSEGDMTVSGGEITITTSGGGVWDTDKSKTKSSACLGADGNMVISGGTLNLTSTGAGGKGINVDGTFTATGGSVTIKTSGHAVVASSTGTLSTVTSSRQLENYDSDHKSSPKGIKIDGAIVISDNALINVTTTGAGGEGIESKYSIDITGGQVIVNASDDAINASYETGNGGSGNLTVSGGYVYARSTGNDGLDANGNCYIKGGLVYAIGSSTPEVAIDANSEEQKKLYVTGGTIVAIGGLERGASLSQSCYSAQSWTRNTWYVLTWGNNSFAFKTPASGGSSLVVSAASTPTLKMNSTSNSMTISGGTEIFGGVGIINPTVSGGSSVSLSSYTGGGGGGPGPGGGGWPPGW
ncbi:MAG: carbohydrate-binding domain-containing protein [Prevotella sp.]|nr:carbohydrate-binding domain-containing protein [Prevotella sp.]